MGRRWLAALIGLCAGAAAFGGYLFAPAAGIHISPDMVVVAGGALAFAAAVAVFSLVVIDRPAAGGAKSPIWLNEEPATEYIAPFRGAHTASMEVTPEMPLAHIMARYQDILTPREDAPKKTITLTLRASPKDKGFSTVLLQQLFLALKPVTLQHVLLVNRKGQFIGYIPGKRAIAEFAGDRTDEKIGKYIVKLLERHDDAPKHLDIRQADGKPKNPDATTVLREIGGAAGRDTIAETDDSRHAEAKIWADESVQGFVVHNHLRPVGYISKADLLRLNVRWP
jgi:hypothetical protein